MINIDLTTNNTVYNTLSPQAQWIQHRFGRRNYPELDLDKSCVIDAITASTDTVNFISVFGDPSQHPNILEILDKIQPGQTAIIHTNLNFNNNDLIQQLNETNSYVVVPLHGLAELHDSVVLYSNWDQVYNNINQLECGVCIEFYVYKHNVHQLKLLKTLIDKPNVEIKIKKGIELHPEGFSCVVNDSGEWLYDVYPCDPASENNFQELYKSNHGYNHLIQFIKPKKGKSILDNPYSYKVSKKCMLKDDPSISVTGHVFPSFKIHEIFSNCLCTDWMLTFADIKHEKSGLIREEFVDVCSIVEHLKSYENNNLLSQSFKDILANFSNSDI